MRPRSAIPFGCTLLAAAATLAIDGAAVAADHGDGRIGLDVISGLAEGPPYAAVPVEIGVELRHPGAESSPAGELHLTLLNAEEASTGDPIPLSGTALDNGDPFGESGDTVALDVDFVEGAPPDAELPTLSLLLWGQRPDPGGAGSPPLEFTNAEPMQIEAELFFQDYEAEVTEVSSGTVLGTQRMRTRFEIAAGQDLRFENVTSSGPDASGELRFSASLRRVAGGSVDPSEPLYRITISDVPLRFLPALLPFALAVTVVLLLCVGIRASR